MAHRQGYAKEYYEKHKEHMKATAKKYAQENKEHVKEYQRNYARKKRASMTEKELEKLRATIKVASNKSYHKRRANMTESELNEFRKQRREYGKAQYYDKRALVSQQAKDYQAGRYSQVEFMAQAGYQDYDELSYQELAEIQGIFSKLAEKYGLQKEFRENGII